MLGITLSEWAALSDVEQTWWLFWYAEQLKSGRHTHGL